MDRYWYSPAGNTLYHQAPNNVPVATLAHKDGWWIATRNGDTYYGKSPLETVMLLWPDLGTYASPYDVQGLPDVNEDGYPY